MSPPDLSDDTCKTEELWLRRIPAGTFWMGSPEGELGREQSTYNTREDLHQVTLTQDFYIGVFQVTQKQYELVMGTKPATIQGDTRPMHTVSYNNIRGSSLGAQWPANHDVDPTSFMGRLRAKTGGALLFDLPTDAQWEYACRAETTTALNSGMNLTASGNCPNMAAVGRYTYNTNDLKGGYAEFHTAVGSYQANAWGLYDMHGNVMEVCLDRYVPGLGTDPVTNPRGDDSTSNTSRTRRGGAYNNDASACRAAYRGGTAVTATSGVQGFRVAIQPPEGYGN